MLKKYSLVLTLLCATLCLSADPLVLTFERLEQAAQEAHSDLVLKDFNQQYVQIRGFLYRTPQGNLILAAQPDLKSCCVGTGSKVKQQVIVQGAIDPIIQQSVVNLQGIFKIDPLYDSDGQLKQFYSLYEAIILPKKALRFPWKILSALVIMLSLLYLLIRLFKN
jgi:hypothetical protein